MKRIDLGKALAVFGAAVALLWVVGAQRGLTQSSRPALDEKRDVAQGIPRAVTCEELLSAGVPQAYAAGLLDGVRSFEISFRTDVYRLRNDGHRELAERSQFVADAIAERLRHAAERSAEELAEALRKSCPGDPSGTAELHFVLALDTWRRDRPL
ncbi:MAG: hypothetical protein HKP27_15460 [Myxococcales bacterium]|nr:hypothetical protein [Myxococcales bacterium]